MVISLRFELFYETKCTPGARPFFVTIYVNEVSGNVVYRNLDLKGISKGNRTTNNGHINDLQLNISPRLTRDGTAMQNAYMGFQFYDLLDNEWGETTSQPVGVSIIYLRELDMIGNYLRNPNTDEVLGDFSIGGNSVDPVVYIKRPIFNHRCEDTKMGFITLKMRKGSILVTPRIKWRLQRWKRNDALIEIECTREKSVSIAERYMQNIITSRLTPSISYLDSIHLCTYETNIATLPGMAFLLNTAYVPREENRISASATIKWLSDMLDISVSRTYRTKAYYMNAFLSQMKQNDHVVRGDFFDLSNLLGRFIEVFDNTLPYNDDFGYVYDKSGKMCRFDCERMEASTDRRSADCEDSCVGCLSVYHLLEQLAILDATSRGDHMKYVSEENMRLLYILSILAKYMFVPGLCLSAVSRKAVRSKEECFAAHIHPYLIPVAFFHENLISYGHLSADVSKSMLRDRNGEMFKRIIMLMKDVDEKKSKESHSWSGIKLSSDSVEPFERNLKPILVDGTGLMDGKLSPLDRYYKGKELDNQFKRVYLTDTIQYEMETKKMGGGVVTECSAADETFDVCKKVMLQMSYHDAGKATRLYKWCTTFMSSRFLDSNGWGNFILVNNRAKRNKKQSLRGSTRMNRSKYGVRYDTIAGLKGNIMELNPIYEYSKSDVSWMNNVSLFFSIPRDMPKPYGSFGTREGKYERGDSTLRLNKDITPSDVDKSFSRARRIMKNMLSKVRDQYVNVSNDNSEQRLMEKVYSEGGIVEEDVGKVIFVTFFYVVNDTMVTNKWTNGFVNAIGRVKCATLNNVRVMEEKYSRESLGFRIDLTWIPTPKCMEKCENVLKNVKARTTN